MAIENIQTNSGTGPKVATDQLATSEHVQYMKLMDGTENSSTPVTYDSTLGFKVQAQGAVASQVADTGNPVKVGGKYNATAPTFADGQRADVQVDTNGNIKITMGTALGAVINNAEADNVGVVPFRRSDAFQATMNSSDASGSDTAVKTATASKRHYVSDLIISVGSAISVTVKDGSTIIGQPLYMAANTTVPVRLSTPYQLSVNSALNVRTSGAGTISVWANGYTI